MKIDSLIAKLHPLERKVLPELAKTTSFKELAKLADLTEIEVMRALQWLENKGALTLESIEDTFIELADNGEKYAKAGLPEKQILKFLDNTFKAADKLLKEADLSMQELNASIGKLKRQGAIEMQRAANGLMLKATKAAKEFLQTDTIEELFLQKEFPINESKLTKDDKVAIKNLSKRQNFIEKKKVKHVNIKLTNLGKNLSKQKIKQDVINRLTPAMLKDGSWKKKDFREYDVEINVPEKFPGKKHFVNQAVDYIKNIWIEMGFSEMDGNYVHSAFWDLDALFVPQDHPAREMQDTYYLNGKASLPEGKAHQDIYKKVKAAHENGAGTGSTGWGYKYSKDEASKIMLRTHTTVLSAATISKLKKSDLPAKFFAVNKVFRNEALDWKHLFEFYQVEGIVVDPKANLKHLKGYLTQFYKKMGYSKVRMRPAHFPYTEPSVEVDVYHPVKKQWVELGGAGIFRPEVVKPLLGIDCPVLAWGQGMGRIISAYWGITDIRDLYKNDLKQLKEMKMWVK